MTNHFAPKVTTLCPSRQRAQDILSVLSVQIEPCSRAACTYKKNAYLSTDLEAAYRMVIYQRGHSHIPKAADPVNLWKMPVYSVTNTGYQAQETETKLKELGIHLIRSGTTF